MIRTLIFGLLMATATPAQSTEDNALFNEYVTNNNAYNSLLDLSVKRVARLTYPNCTDKIILSKRFQTPLLNAQFTNTDDDAKSPNYGQWIEHVLISFCNKKTAINHLVAAYDSPNPIILPLLNGRTKLDSIDQPLAENAIADSLMKLQRPCDANAFIIDTNVIGYRTQDGKGLNNTDNNNGWFEKWDIHACDTNYTVNLAILPNPQTRYKYVVRLKEKE